MEKFIIKQHETAVYEIFADSEEDAKKDFEFGGGDFLGYEESNNFIITVEKEDEWNRISLPLN